MYAKIFDQIFDSSLAEDYRIRHVFMDLLVLADPDGVVDMTLTAVARRTNVPEDLVREAIKKLSKPDPESRSGEEEGRRLVPLDPGRSWGWKIVNFAAYDRLRSETERRAYMRYYMRTRRAQEKGQDTPCKHPVNSGKQPLAPLAPTTTDTATATKGGLLFPKESLRDVDEGRSDSPPPVKDADRPFLKPLVDQFVAAAKWCGSTDKVYEHFGAARGFYGEGVLSEAIARLATPGAKPWTITDALAEEAGPDKKGWLTRTGEDE